MGEIALLPSVASMVRSADRMDRFAKSLPAFRAAGLVKAEVTVLNEALDLASQAEDQEHFSVWMTAAECSARRMEKHITGLLAEIKAGRK